MVNDILYKCDPNKFKECRKTACQELCQFTSHKEYSIDNKEYKYNADKDEYEVVDARQ